MKRSRNSHSTSAGFTLIELLVVLVILGLLAGLVGPQVMKYLGTSKTSTARLQLEDIGAALDLYRLEVAEPVWSITVSSPGRPVVEPRSQATAHRLGHRLRPAAP